MFRVMLVATLIGVSFTASAIPKISVGQMYDFIESDKSTLLKRINNHGEDTAFVKTEVSEVIYGADGKKEDTRIDANAAANGNIDGLIFTPSRMIIPAKGMQSGRMVVTGSRAKERYYRIRFIPVMPKDQYEFGQTQKQFDQYKKTLNAGVSLLTGYGSMVIVRPAQVKFNTLVEEKNQQIVITNSGNSSITLDELKKCSGKKCTEGVSLILLPGKKHVLNKEKNTVWQFTLLEGNKKSPKHFG